MNYKKSALSQSVLTTTGSLLLAGATSLYAHPETLDESTILATKFEATDNETTSSVSVVSSEALKNQQLSLLSASLDLLTGVQGNALGPSGTAGSLLTRGLPTRYSQVVVDGVRIADSTSGLGNFLATSSIGLTNQLEFLKGPQSVLYGGEAAGGVLGYDTSVGGANITTIESEAGSFDSYKASIATQGQLDQLEYSIQLGQEFTNNDPSDEVELEDFTLDSRVLGLQWYASNDLSIKFTYRGSNSEYETNFGKSVVETDLFTLNTKYLINEVWNTKLTLGYYDESTDLPYSTSSFQSEFKTDLERFSLNWANQLTLSDSVELVAGYEYTDTSYSRFSDNNFSTPTTRSVDFETHAIYANTSWKATEALLLEVGIRSEEHTEFENNIAWNVGASYDIESTGTRFRARIAESFRTPTLLDSERFVGAFGTQSANSDLNTETILGYELGVVQKLAGQHYLELSYFNQEIENAIFRGTSFTNPGESQQQNSEDDSTVSGIELAANGSFYDDQVNYRFAWTWQDKEEVIDVPDHLISADISYNAGNWLVGAGASYSEGANYSSAASSTAPVDNRLVARLYGHYEINQYVKLHGRIENVFDEEYEISPFGDQGPGNSLGAYAGVTISF
ncbi:MAG: TonB-dependent receptor plug domain-containing protein [Akkermansiaceae bacterium]